MEPGAEQPNEFVDADVLHGPDVVEPPKGLVVVPLDVVEPPNELVDADVPPGMVDPPGEIVVEPPGEYVVVAKEGNVG